MLKGRNEKEEIDFRLHLEASVCDFEVPGNLKVELLPCSTERMLKFL